MALSLPTSHLHRFSLYAFHWFYVSSPPLSLSPVSSSPARRADLLCLDEFGFCLAAGMEVENITFPFQREWRNADNETAKDVFKREHHNLAEQGEKWMKDTVNSHMLVSALIATVLFAGAFTVPGGNGNDNGIAIFLHTNTFMIFAISDALGLFSSLTSLLSFLSIITAQYDPEEFRESLPHKLIIGLGSLYFSIANMLIAFGSALTIILSERWHWVSVPITLLASYPVALFVMLELPLFLYMIQSTYGPSILYAGYPGF